MMAEHSIDRTRSDLRTEKRGTDSMKRFYKRLGYKGPVEAFGSHTKLSPHLGYGFAFYLSGALV